MGKRGIIPLKFLMTVILALIIFVPTLLGLSRLFAVEDSRPKESFLELVDTINEAAEKESGWYDSIVLYMRDNSAIVYFDEDDDDFLSSLIVVKPDRHKSWGAMFLARGVNANFKIDRLCERGKKCLCLAFFEDYKFDCKKLSSGNRQCSTSFSNVKSVCREVDTHVRISYMNFDGLLTYFLRPNNILSKLSDSSGQDIQGNLRGYFPSEVNSISVKKYAKESVLVSNSHSSNDE